MLNTNQLSEISNAVLHDEIITTRTEFIKLFSDLKIEFKDKINNVKTQIKEKTTVKDVCLKLAPIEQKLQTVAASQNKANDIFFSKISNLEKELSDKFNIINKELNNKVSSDCVWKIAGIVGTIFSGIGIVLFAAIK